MRRDYTQAQRRRERLKALVLLALVCLCAALMAWALTVIDRWLIY